MSNVPIRHFRWFRHDERELQQRGACLICRTPATPAKARLPTPFYLVEQLANFSIDVACVARWYGKDQRRWEQTFERALKLLALTITDARWKGRRKELTLARELSCDAMLDGTY